jgi:hypothetical protein
MRAFLKWKYLFVSGGSAGCGVLLLPGGTYVCCCAIVRYSSTGSTVTDVRRSNQNILSLVGDNCV